MEFMKRAIEKQKEEAKQDAEKLIQALQEEKEWDESNEESNESEENDGQIPTNRDFYMCRSFLFGLEQVEKAEK